jgi:hypothetical protein
MPSYAIASPHVGWADGCLRASYAAWCRLPKDVRDTLAEGFPAFELCHELDGGRWVSFHPDDGLALVAWPKCKPLPYPLAAVVFAHLFGHIYLHHIGREDWWGDGAVDDLTARWGLPSRALEEHLSRQPAPKRPRSQPPGP